jgi:hypothetical protein
MINENIGRCRRFAHLQDALVKLPFRASCLLSESYTLSASAIGSVTLIGKP